MEAMRFRTLLAMTDNYLLLLFLLLLPLCFMAVGILSVAYCHLQVILSYDP